MFLLMFIILDGGGDLYFLQSIELDKTRNPGFGIQEIMLQNMQKLTLSEYFL